MPKAFSGQPAMVSVTYRPQANADIVDGDWVQPSRAHHLGQPRNFMLVKLLSREWTYSRQWQRECAHCKSL
jgi:hypothetical protein